MRPLRAVLFPDESFRADLEQIPAETLLLTVVGDDDRLVRDIDAKRIFIESTRVPLAFR
jgi:hypothetical protein